MQREKCYKNIHSPEKTNEKNWPHFIIGLAGFHSSKIIVLWPASAHHRRKDTIPFARHLRIIFHKRKNNVVALKTAHCPWVQAAECSWVYTEYHFKTDWAWLPSWSYTSLPCLCPVVYFECFVYVMQISFTAPKSQAMRSVQWAYGHMGIPFENGYTTVQTDHPARYWQAGKNGRGPPGITT